MDLFGIILALIIFSFLIVAGLKIPKANVISPWTITGGVWCGILILLLFWGDYLYPLKGTFISSLIIWVITFYIFSVTAFNVTKGKMQWSFRVRNSIFNFFIIVSIITLPLYLYITYEALKGDYSNILFTLRKSANEGETDYGILVYLRALNMALFIIGLWMYPNISKYKYYYLLIVNIIMGLSFMEKGTFFFILISVLYVFYVKKIVSLRKICIYLSVFVGCAFIFNTFRSNKAIENADFMKFITIYISSPAVAYETLSENIYGEFGINTFPFFYKISNVIFGTDFEVISKVKDFVYVPVRTNVYTVLQPFYQDFGNTGVAIFAAIYGIFCGYVYKKSLLGYPVMKCLYLYIANILVLQFFQENLILSLSVLIQYIIIFNIIVVKHGN